MASTAACNNNNSNGHSNNLNGSSPSPPQSPRRRCPRRQCSIPPRRTLRRSSKNLLSISVGHDLIPVIRRCLRYWLLIPLLYVSGLIVCICPISIFILPHHHIPPAPGSVYRSDEVFKAVWSDMQMDNSSGIKMSAMWIYNKKLKLPDDDQNQRPCLTRSIKKQHHNKNHPTVSPVRYLIVEANGGLNQQRASICNAVVVAGLLNATLVIPHFNYHNVWMDRSEFGDIYDSDHFITTLNTSISVVRELPPMSLLEIFNNSISNIPPTHVPAWATIQYYLEEINPILQYQGVIRIAPFANRLAMNIPPYYQHLRCLANYKALKFAPSISTLAKQLVKRLVEKSKVHDGKYVSVHLRFEEDMVAFSCCMYGGGRQETTLMESLRMRGWKGKFEKRRRDQNTIDPGLNRMNGKCPLTPVEVGMMLRGMGFTNTTIIYLASGKLYQPQKYLTPLLQMFPLVYTKETLTTPEELASFNGYSSRLAAVDYIVCLLSEVFVTTQGGNFPHFLMGHRRFMYGGHAKTIKPNKMKLVRMFHNTTVSWGVVREEMKLMLVESNREGMMMGKKRKSRRRNSIYEYPFQDCKCVQHFSSLNSMEILDTQQLHSFFDKWLNL